MRDVTAGLAAGMLLATPLFAELAVEPIYQSHMVLQQGQQVPICGTCTEKTPIQVSFAGQKVTATVKGNTWTAVLAPMAARAEGAALTVTQGSEKVTLDDVVVGEVWLASGQSNMFWRLEETRDRAALQSPENPNLRICHAEPLIHTRPPVYTQEEREMLKAGKMYRQGTWCVSSPATCRKMSAVGWYFGRALQKQLGVPVGIIHVSLGGSEMLAWMPQQMLEKNYPEVLTDEWMNDKNVDPYWVRARALKNLGDDLTTPHPYSPGYLYKTGITPWLKYPVAGIIWYQGESDAPIEDQERNRRVLSDLITAWRAGFRKPQLPFCMVQLPRIKDLTHERVLWPEFREVQSRVSRELPNVLCTVTIDLGTTNRDVHPPRKLEVGERMAALTAAKVYGVKGIPYSGPVFAKTKLADGKVKVSFAHAEGLKTTNGAAPACFELSADGKTYHPAEAELEKNAVLLSSAEVKNPRYVRYAWSTFVEPNLVNGAGLPTAPFASPIPSPAK